MYRNQITRVWAGMAGSKSLEGARLSQDLLMTITSSKIGKRQSNPLSPGAWLCLSESRALVHKTGIAIVPVSKDGHEGE